MSHSSLSLVPLPRSLSYLEGEHPLHDNLLILLLAEDAQALLFTAQQFRQALQAEHQLNWEINASRLVPSSRVGLELRFDPKGKLPPQGYELLITPDAIQIQAGDLAGVFYGVCTIIQIIAQCGGYLPCLHITDWPDFPARGVMLDISRDRVPTMETLYALVDQLAGWKINQLQLYMEHTFAYQQHPQVWAGASPFTGQEILELNRFCQERFIDLVPNQQSFGHLAPWLNLPQYKSLAEVENGFQTPWDYRPGSFSLAPINPESVSFLQGLYAELLPHFSSRMFNIGGDETWDLGQGRSQAACAARGKGRVYLDFLLKIFEEVRCWGRTPQFWGDIITEYPDLIPELPRHVIALEWGYEADHPFDLHGAEFAASGIPFYVCPGTSSWCSLAGRTDNAIRNLVSAAENGLKHGAAGYLNTDWGDNGHWQAWPMSTLGFMLGAAYSWSLESNRGLDIPAALSWHGFGDSGGASGKLAYELGNLYRVMGIEPHNSSALFWLMQWSLDKIRSFPGLAPGVMEKASQSIEAAAGLIPQLQIERPDAGLIQSEFGLTIHLLRHACRRGQLALENDPQQARRQRGELATDIVELIREFRGIWLQRNRVGGLDDSIARFEKLHQEYLAGETP